MLKTIDEILNAENDLGINIRSKGIIPFIDCGDNEFIAYNLGKYTWCKYNIGNDFEYAQKKSILLYFD